MYKILISSCLLGYRVRYDGADNNIDDQILLQWKQDNRLVSLCPEVSGGLPIPRPACEIVGGDGNYVLKSQAKVLSKKGEDFSQQYIKGANIALELVKKYSIKIAILKKNSPSCGNDQIYDGTFTRNKIAGLGVVASLLIQNNVKVFNESQLQEAKKYLESLE